MISPAASSSSRRYGAASTAVALPGAGEMIAPMGAESTATEFESHRQRHLRAFADRLPVEAERLTWSLSGFTIFAMAPRALLRTAKARSPWHAEASRRRRCRAVTGADLAAIPTMTKPM